MAHQGPTIATPPDKWTNVTQWDAEAGRGVCVAGGGVCVAGGGVDDRVAGGVCGCRSVPVMLHPPTVSRDKYIHVDEMAYDSLERTAVVC